MAEEYTYLTSGANQSLIRSSGEPEQYDNANVDGLLGDNSLSGQKVVNLDYAKITNVEVQTAQIADAAITNAKIVSLAVEKILAGVITSKAIVLAADGTGDSVLRAGKTNFDNTVSGFILGLDDSDSDLAKFFIGNDTTYLNWTGTAFIIVGGTITGPTIQTGTTGRRMKFSGADSQLQWLLNDSVEGFIYNDGSGNMVIDADNLIYIRADGAGDDIFLTSGDDIFLDAGDDIVLSGNDVSSVCTGDFTVICDRPLTYFNDDNDGADCFWVDVGGGSDTLMRLDNSDESLYIDGLFVDTGADFAEFFEATDEFSASKIPFGTSVALHGDKIRPCSNGEMPFGVISSKPTIVGNSGGTGADTQWGGKYLKDEFGNYIMEEAEWWSKEVVEKIEKPTGQKIERKKKIRGYSDRDNPPVGSKKKIVTRKKLNPSWVKESQYIPRKDRPEWNIVGLIGRVPILKGQPTAPNWIKLRDVSETVEEWLIR